MKHKLVATLIIMSLTVIFIASCNSKSQKPLPTPIPESIVESTPLPTPRSLTEDEQAMMPKFETIIESDLVEYNAITIVDVESLVSESIPETSITLWMADGSGKPKEKATFELQKNTQIKPVEDPPAITFFTPAPTEKAFKLEPSSPTLQIVPNITPFVIEEKKTEYKLNETVKFINKSDDDIRWFAYKIDGVKPEKIVWQVSRFPYSTINADWEAPHGLLNTSTIPVDDGEFSIDFKHLKKLKMNSNLIILKTLQNRRLFMCVR